MFWIKLKAYSKEPLNKCTNRIVLAFRAAGNFSVRGPVHLLTKIVECSVNESPRIGRKVETSLRLECTTG
ncbi:MAG: 30S ribosomal protein S10 [Candidatus Hodgkinia cicadicola]|nr:MAG: 30S ribosomal protein S10 [Candidatus Hodgkinia cicadicola]